MSPHKYFPPITQICSMLLGSHKYFPHYYPTWTLTNIPYISPINYLGPSHTYYPHIIQLGFTQKYPSYYYQNWATKLYYLKKKAKNIYLMGKSKKPNKTPSKAGFYTAL